MISMRFRHLRLEGRGPSSKVALDEPGMLVLTSNLTLLVEDDDWGLSLGSSFLNLGITGPTAMLYERGQSRGRRKYP